MSRGDYYRIERLRRRAATRRQSEYQPPNDELEALQAEREACLFAIRKHPSVAISMIESGEHLRLFEGPEGASYAGDRENAP